MNNRKKKRILFVIWGLGEGGAERVLLNILKFLNYNKFEPVLVFFKKGGTYFNYLPPRLKFYNLGKKSRFDFPKLIIKLTNIIVKEKPEIILSFGHYANIIVGFSKFFFPLKLSNTKVCLTEHTYTEMFIGNLKFSAVRKWLVRWLYRRADLIIAVSNGVKNNLIKVFALPEDKIKVCYNPIDLDDIWWLSREPVGHKWFKNPQFIIIAVGNISAAKGYSYLLKAFCQVRKEIPARLVILGGGEKKTLEELAGKLGIKEDIALLGFQNNPFKYMVRSTVFVLPSLWEGFGNVIVEAMACGIPVVATNIGSGPKEIISNGKNGFLVSVGDVNRMAKYIIELLKNQSIRKKLTEAGRKKAEDFRAEKKVAEYERILEELLDIRQD